MIEGLPGGLLAEFPDWHVEPQEFTEAGDAILVRNLDTATGRESGVPIRQPFTQVWPFRGGRPVLVEKSGRGCRIGAVLFVVGVRPPTRGGANLKEPRS